jgi:putative ABC transport system ATP-binding protein
VLIAENVRFAYGETVALAGFSATVSPGEVVAIVGPSGSGKSTLLYCLSGLLAPSSGAVRFRDRCLSELTDAERSDLRCRSFGFVFQFGELVPELTLRENIALPLDLVRAPRDLRRRRVAELTERLGLNGHADRRPATVSAGQAQRAAVARAIVHRPAVMFADEPTGALDSVNADIVISALIELAREQDTAVVVVTHDLVVASRADRVIVLRDGAVAIPGEAA